MKNLVRIRTRDLRRALAVLAPVTVDMIGDDYVLLRVSAKHKQWLTIKNITWENV